MAQDKDVFSVGGSHTHIILELSRAKLGEALFYLGSALTVSYSVFRDKRPVFNCGSSVIDGVSIGNKYVAGSIISVMYSQDDMSRLIETIKEDAVNRQGSKEPGKSNLKYRISSIKEMRTFGRDDIVSFNMHCLFTSEYSEDLRRVILYDVTMLNNGKVMSINDLITEDTMSFIASNVSEQGNGVNLLTSEVRKESVLTASQLI